MPVPGFGAPRFDAVGSWPPVVDRAVIGVEHFFPYWPVDGKVVFDPEGSGAQPVSLRAAGHAWFAQFLEPRAASLAFGLCGLAVIFAVLLVCHRKRWILKL